MAVADLYISYGNVLLPLTDVGGQAKPMTSVLAQVLLKCSSNDKKFVIEEAQRALQVRLAGWGPGRAAGSGGQPGVRLLVLVHGTLVVHGLRWLGTGPSGIAAVPCWLGAFVRWGTNTASLLR